MNRFLWTDSAKADLRQIEQSIAIDILKALTRYGETGHGDVKRLQDSPDYRLRVGDYRVRFERLEGGVRKILRVSHRREAYR